MDPEDPELQLTLEEAGVSGASSEALSQAISSVESNLESEQQKLATLLKNLAGEVGGREGREEVEAVQPPLTDVQLCTAHRPCVCMCVCVASTGGNLRRVASESEREKKGMFLPPFLANCFRFICSPVLLYWETVWHKGW